MFEELNRRPGLARDRLSWYGERAEEMKRTLLCYQDEDCLPGKSSSGQAAATQSNHKAKTSSKTPGRRGTLRLYQIIDSQPAGNQPPDSVDAHHIGYVELDRMQIQGKPHNIVSLLDDHVIDVHSCGKYKLLKVAGTCMELRGIDDGDYVLLWVDKRQKNDDIVAFENVRSGHTNLILRKLIIEDDIMILEAESDDDCHTPINRTFQEFNILLQGVALAVFKPL